MNSRPELKLDWCNHAAAKYAVEHWHYSKCLPCGKLLKVGVWEAGRFIGAVIFSRGANNNIGKPFRLEQTNIAELTRIALDKHTTPVTRIASIAILFLKRNSPGIRLLVSYADPAQGHHGGIYQGGGWIYCGASQAQREVMHAGAVMHKRTANALFGTIKGMKKSPILWKHKYLMPLDAEMRARILPLAKPYPKRAKLNSFDQVVSLIKTQDALARAGSDTKDTPANHAGKGGSMPTPALHS